MKTKNTHYGASVSGKSELAKRLNIPVDRVDRATRLPGFPRAIRFSWRVDECADFINKHSAILDGNTDDLNQLTETFLGEGNNEQA
jgi:hypothetical protein